MAKKNKKAKLGSLFALIIFVLVVYLLFKHTDYITGILKKSGPWAPIVAIVLYTVLAPTPVTTDPITIILGVTYGPLMGLGIAWVGNTLAALVEYYVGYKIHSVINEKQEVEDMPFGLGKLPVNSIPFLVFGRMIPGYGAKIISLLAGAHSVPIRRYLWTTALTNLLGSLLLAYGGFGIFKLLK